VWDDVGFGGKKGSIWNSSSAIKCMSVLTDGTLLIPSNFSTASFMASFAGQPLEFKDLKASALMASDG
jgi:hypothetical protein